MTTNPPSNTPSKAPKPANTAVKQLPFAFPFLPKRQGHAGAPATFTDEHEIYPLLATGEAAGSYLVSANGLWHGGIHITEAGAGQALDLESGVRCIADGQVIAYRVNRTYPVSELPAQNGQPAIHAPYSTGFALVRHTMEFPKGTTLTFYSLYMHLQAYDDYANYPQRQKPSYWATQFKVTGCAQDMPVTGKNGQAPGADQKGIRVRKTPPGGEIIGILPQGASVSIGERRKGYGQITNMHGSSLHPRLAGGLVEPLAAVGGWIFMGIENGGPVVEAHMPDASFDQVVIASSTAGASSDSQEHQGIPVKAGDLIGHLGRYDSLNQPTSTRMVHVEVFCDETIRSFIDQGVAWVDDHGPHPEDWASLGLPADPTILRIAPHTKLYHDHKQDGEGADAPVTDVTQVYSLAELVRNPDNQFTETQPNSLGRKVSWWQVDSANAMRNPVHGWVREESFAGGRVTREFAQGWVDFQCFDDAHDPAHTIFATTKAWVDYAKGENVPNPGALDRLSPLMQKVYRALFATGDGSRAADNLCSAAGSSSRGYPWLMQAASRLIVQHESEWANPEKWKQLIVELEKQTEPKPQHAEELKRIDSLVWWDKVKAGVPGFPGPEVFHIHPIGLVANFVSQCACINYDAIWEPNPAPAYRDGQIVPHSHYRLPIDTTAGRLSGRSRRGGDATKEVQAKVIDFLVKKSRNNHLIREDIAMVLAMTRHESGFNPDAAAGTTSASGLGQFVDGTAASYGINTDGQRFDAEQGADAMVRHYLENKRLAQKSGAAGRNLFVMIYAYHHDGPSLAYGGKAISESKVMPWFDTILKNLCMDVAD